ncbi:MAG: lysophospholipid acyltransferase family protein [bacterium]|nr:lysophospholipid acyltransferase family protein [bacterium]
MIYTIAKLISYIFCKIYFRLEVKGADNVPKKGGVLVASNHSSFLDPVIVGVGISRATYYLTKQNLFKIPIFGLLIKSLHTIPVRREQVSISTFKELIRSLHSKKAVILFPEGTRSIDGKLGQGKIGIGMLALKANVPIVPAYIDGATKAFPKYGKWIHPKKIRVIFGKPIMPNSKDPNKNNYRRISAQVMESINRLKENITC